MSVIVAIDGPAGSGKSSVSKEAARRLRCGYLDTGAAYRSLAWDCVDRGVGLDDAEAVAAVAAEHEVIRPLNPDQQRHTVRGVDVTDAIRGEDVSQSVSAVAAHQQVRDTLNTGFRRLVANSGYPGVIVEGRDITTVVAPDSPARILLTADEAVRIARREAENTGVNADALAARDAADSKVVNFMTAADGVWTLDTTEMGFDEVVSAVVEFIVQRTQLAVGT